MSQTVDQARIEELKNYIIHFQQQCDRCLPQIADVGGKSVLVVGSGWGTETLWCLRNGAAVVTGIDIGERGPEPLMAAIKQLGIDQSTPWKTLRLSIADASNIGKFDVVLSNNVFEHIANVDQALAVICKVVKRVTGRIAIHANPLFFSSCGAHLPREIEPWRHLWDDESELESAVSALQWHQYKHGLNRMTVNDFLAAFAKHSLLIRKLEFVADRNSSKLNRYLPRIAKKTDVQMADLLTEGISCSLVVR